ncbi:MAG: DUF4864 domain-containing protein [Betaproteobacteria bacterium]
MNRLRRAMPAWLLAVLLLGAGTAAGQADPHESTLAAAEWSAIREVISEQLVALKSGDGDRAFGHASPGIRAQFGDAGNFMRMVREGYPALVAARYTEFLDGAVIGGIVIQPLRLVAPDNTVLVALYTMQKLDEGRWKIAGCALAPSTVLST